MTTLYLLHALFWVLTLAGAAYGLRRAAEAMSRRRP